MSGSSLLALMAVTRTFDLICLGGCALEPAPVSACVW